MVGVGVIGLGMMGGTHLDVLAGLGDRARVVAVADRDEARLSGASRAGGNIQGQARGGFDLSRARGYREASELIADPEVHAVHICLPTPAHLPVGLEAIAAGKHVLIEKPLARTAADAEKLADAADAAGVIAMPGMCMRFWPAWAWLKGAIDRGDDGPVRSAHFTRLAAHPAKGDPDSFYASGEASGGAILDLHLHDTDFVHHLFGPPRAVTSFGYKAPTSAVDHVVTRYDYGAGPLVVAEGGWAMAPAFPFTMRYVVNFERATAVYTLGADLELTVSREGSEPEPVEGVSGMGYEHEVAYFIDCVSGGRQPSITTLRDAAAAIRTVEAEAESVETGRPVTPETAGPRQRAGAAADGV